MCVRFDPVELLLRDRLEREPADLAWRPSRLARWAADSLSLCRAAVGSTLRCEPQESPLFASFLHVICGAMSGFLARKALRMLSRCSTLRGAKAGTLWRSQSPHQDPSGRRRPTPRVNRGAGQSTDLVSPTLQGET